MLSCGYLRGQENDQRRREENQGEGVKTAGGNYTSYFWTRVTEFERLIKFKVQ